MVGNFIKNFKENEMKKILFTIALAGLFLVGCQDANFNPVSPDQNQAAINKTDMHGIDAVDDILHNASNTALTVHQELDGKRGGRIQIDTEAKNSEGKSVRINVDLNFDKGAFNGIQDIAVIVNPDNASITFFPHIAAFNKKVKLDASIEGVDLSKLNIENSKKAHFVYFDDNGNVLQIIKCKDVRIDYKNGKLSVKNAELKHFSRYGWAT